MELSHSLSLIVTEISALKKKKKNANGSSGSLMVAKSPLNSVSANYTAKGTKSEPAESDHSSEKEHESESESETEVHDVDTEDDDSADKMEAFVRSVSDGLKDEKPCAIEASKRIEDKYLISLSSSTTNSDEELDEDNDEDENIEVSFVAGPSPKTRVNVLSSRTRYLVVDALGSLGRRFRRCPFTSNVEVRKHARVPIVAMTTRFGFDVDVGIGGHVGTDTSSYATSQVTRFKSFAPLVLVLKIMLQQNDLDKPFTGGLGSYKLYVLVAYHLEQRLASGENDNPAEALVSFFRRYGGCENAKRIKRKSAVTDLAKLDSIECDGGLVELNSVFKLSDCLELFRLCNEKVMSMKNFDLSGVSVLAQLIDHVKLCTQRESCRKQSEVQPQQNNFQRMFNRVAKKGKEAAPPKMPAKSKKRKRSEEGRSPLATRTKKNRLEQNGKHQHSIRIFLENATKNRKKKKKQNRDKGKRGSAMASIDI